MMFRTAFPTDFPCSPRPFQVKSAPHLQLKVINTLRPGPRGFWGGLRHRMVLLLALLLTAATSAFTQTTNVRINCGGPAYTDAAGHNWLADTYFVGGTKYSFGTKSVAGTNDPALYQTERYADAYAHTNTDPERNADSDANARWKRRQNQLRRPCLHRYSRSELVCGQVFRQWHQVHLHPAGQRNE